MPNIGGGELIWVLAIALLLFGGKKLPELGSAVGKSIKNFKHGVEDSRSDEAEADPSTEAPAPAEAGEQRERG